MFLSEISPRVPRRTSFRKISLDFSLELLIWDLSASFSRFFFSWTFRGFLQEFFVGSLGFTLNQELLLKFLSGFLKVFTQRSSWNPCRNFTHQSSWISYQNCCWYFTIVYLIVSCGILFWFPSISDRILHSSRSSSWDYIRKCLGLIIQISWNCCENLT